MQSETTGHSPGPWEAPRYELPEVRTAAGDLIATVYAGIPAGQPVTSLDLARAQDNARLIAAAPDLLAALQEISALLDAAPSSGVPAQTRAIARGAALVAIAKALGS